MTLAKRIIPSVLVRGKTAFKGPGFGVQCTRSVGSALAIARTHARRGVDEVLVLDIGATPEGRGPDLDLVRALSDDCYIPITVGGGVRSLDHIDALLRAGADKVAICSAVRDDMSLLMLARDRFGAQALVGVIEHEDDDWDDTAAIAIEMDEAGAGEILLQSRSREGTLGCYDLRTLRIASSAVKCPVIVSGGCGQPEHMVDALRLGADACCAGAVFQFTDTTPRDCALYLKSRGIEVRL
jgi:cyclase